MEYYSNVMLYASIATAAILIGGIIAIIKKPGAKLRSAILHFAAGVIFSVVAVELLPDIMANHATWEIVIGFGGGVLLMLAIRYFLEPEEDSNSDNNSFPTAFMVVIGIDLLIDGVLMGIGFVTSQETGVLLAIALSVELLALGMATTITLSNYLVSRKTILLSILGLSAIVLVSTLLSAVLLSDISAAYLEIVLSFGLAALLFLVTEELLVEAHETQRNPLLTATFFAGFLLFMLLPGG